eukprot:89998-Pelagomonas_calceolata.AAC.3
MDTSIKSVQYEGLETYPSATFAEESPPMVPSGFPAVYCATFLHAHAAGYCGRAPSRDCILPCIDTANEEFCRTSREYVDLV